MTSPGRAYVVAASLAVFFVLWAGIAARPWAPQPQQDPRVAALARREALVRRDAHAAQVAYATRWAAYRAALAERTSVPVSVASAPQVRIVQLPPAATTRSS